MFKISAIQDKKLQKQAIEACGGTYNEDFFAYTMNDTDTGELMGIAQFEIGGEYGHISDLRQAPGLDDFEAMFILGRATMNFIDLCGAHKCTICANASDERLIKAIGFKLSESGEYFADMTNMFSGHCDGHEINLK